MCYCNLWSNTKSTFCAVAPHEGDIFNSFYELYKPIHKEETDTQKLSKSWCVGMVNSILNMFEFFYIFQQRVNAFHMLNSKSI